MEKVDQLCSLDNFTIFIPDEENELYRIKENTEKAGFPITLESETHKEDRRTGNLFIGRQYLQFFKVNKSISSAFSEALKRWSSEGKIGVVAMELRTRSLDVIYNILRRRGVYIKEPYRPQYSMKKEKKSYPWRYLDLPALENLPLQIRWIERDPMVENMIASKPRPNSIQKNGAREISKVTVSGPFTDRDLEMIKMVFPGTAPDSGNYTELKSGSINLEKSDNTKFVFETPTTNETFVDREVNLYNFRLRVIPVS